MTSFDRQFSRKNDCVGKVTNDDVVIMTVNIHQSYDVLVAHTRACGLPDSFDNDSWGTCRRIADRPGWLMRRTVAGQSITRQRPRLIGVWIIRELARASASGTLRAPLLFHGSSRFAFLVRRAADRRADVMHVITTGISRWACKLGNSKAACSSSFVVIAWFKKWIRHFCQSSRCQASEVLLNRCRVAMPRRHRHAHAAEPSLVRYESSFSAASKEEYETSRNRRALWRASLSSISQIADRNTYDAWLQTASPVRKSNNLSN